jgi:hypothetical protein
MEHTIMARREAARPARDPSINGFCNRWGISRSTFNNWNQRGIGPRVTQPAGPGGRGLISEEDEDNWALKHKRASG